MSQDVKIDSPEMLARKKRSAERKQAWAVANREKVRAQKDAWIARNPLKDKQAKRAHYERNKDYYNARAAEYWRERPEEKLVHTQKRRAAIVRATPPWVDKKAIREIVNLAKSQGLTVDHIVPLQSNIVSGLHVPANLQIVPMKENHRKFNKEWPDMP